MTTTSMCFWILLRISNTLLPSTVHEHAGEDIANQTGNRVKRNFIDNGIEIQILRSLRISLTSNSIMVGFINPFVDFRLQVIQVMTRPIQLNSEVAINSHDEVELSHEKEAKNKEGCGNPHPETRRLLQESEESRHAFTVQRHQEVTAQTEPSHQRGDCTATHTRSNNPEDVS